MRGRTTGRRSSSTTLNRTLRPATRIGSLAGQDGMCVRGKRRSLEPLGRLILRDPILQESQHVLELRAVSFIGGYKILMGLEHEPRLVEFRLIRADQTLLTFAESHGMFTGVNREQPM